MKAGPGRPKGSQNKRTLAAKAALESAFQKLGGAKALAAWAEANPTDFYRIWSKLVPQPREVSGPDGGPVNVSGVILLPTVKDSE